MTRRTLSLTSLAILCAFLGVLLSGSAIARKRGGFGPGIEPTESQKAIHSLKAEIAAVELYNALALDADQQTALAEVISGVIAEREARQAARQANAPELEGLLQDYLAEVKKDGAPSDATVAALKDFRAANKPEKGAGKEKREQVRETLQSILSEEQLETLHGFRPMAAAGPSPEEMEQRRERRGEQLRERATERGFDAERAERRMEHRGDKRERRRGKQMVKRVLMSPEFLDLLN